ncbi:amino acid permease, partial [Mitsuokella jalaludinii]|uniref:amino acid permease n=1 Tax=Mitsuokella jalaludinii TaxID=187979 RepID=UPI00307F9944
HMLPPIFSRYNRFHTPYVAILFATLVGILIALSGSFTTLAAISVVSRFAQYVPTCLAILVLRRRDPEHPSTLPVPFGPVIPVIPVIAVLVSLWLLVQADLHKILFGLGGVGVVPVGDEALENAVLLPHAQAVPAALKKSA